MSSQSGIRGSIRDDRAPALKTQQKFSAIYFFSIMSKAEFEAAKGAFLAAYETAEQIAKYRAPLEERKAQLSDVGVAAVLLLISRPTDD